MLSLTSGAGEKPVVTAVNPVPSATNARFEIPGRTEPVEQATIFTRATGIVKERRFDIGDRVKAGDVLAVIDVPELDRELESATASVEQAESRAHNARQVADRAGGLLSARAISQEDFDLRITTARAADAALRVAQAELARVQQLRAFATVTAPFDGTVSARNFDRGDRVRGDSSTAEGWLYRIARLDELRFVVSATPDLALRVSKGNKALVRFNELPGKRFEAGVSRSSGVFDTASGTMRVECLLGNKDLALPAGLTGTAVFELPPMESTFSLPNNTLVIRQGKPLVALADGGKVSFVEVLPGRNLGTTVEVTSSKLATGSLVIVNPNAMLREGDAVEVKTAAVVSK
jgi:RND family efflux transporter MFP subunit